MKKITYAIILLPLFFCFINELRSQNKEGVVASSSYIKEGTIIDSGFISTFHQDDRQYLIIPEPTLGRDILVTITILRGSAYKEKDPEMRFGYGGDSVFEKLIRLVKNKGRIEIQDPKVIYEGRPNSIYSSYLNSIEGTVITSAPIIEKIDSGYIIDITDIIMEDSELFSLKGSKDMLKLGEYKKHLSYPTNVKAFSENINFSSVRYYSVIENKEKKDGGQNYNNTAWEVGACWLLLPKIPMKPRLAESRIGYFTKFLTGVNGWKDMEQGMQSGLTAATRWRLEPKDEDMERYFKGELVEPEKPIIFFIDRATPDYLVPSFIKAVEAWQPVFERVGFRNAIQARLAPTKEEDPEYCEADTRYNLISYKASPIPNAYGPMVTDPRSGEIITSHVAIFHSVQDLLQRWYFVMCSVVDTNARKYPLSREIMGTLAGTVLTHEVGHTLGLMHDYIGSTAYPVDSLRNKSFIRNNGLGASIMDYQRFNYLAQPEDSLELQDLCPRIGVYDNYAIEWGYRYLPDSLDVVSQTEILKKWVDEKRKNPELLFVKENDLLDPRVQAEDFGSDVIYANNLGIKNLKVIMNNIQHWTPNNDPNFYPLRRRYLSVLNQYNNYINHVLKIIGGRYIDNIHFEEDLTLYRPVPAERQLEALKFIETNLIKEPEWLYRQDIMDKTRIDYSYYVLNFVSTTLGKLFAKASEVLKTEELSEAPFSFDIIVETLYKSIFESKDSKPELTRYERMIQNEFVIKLTIFGENQTSNGNGTGVLYKRVISDIKNLCISQIEKHPDTLVASHYQGIINYITIWENGKQSSILYNL
ncbi:MAG: zinc-dependent metalloprotease [Eubacteriales bacterium]|nr:zinc-dependent metalloprotease [Eubacteriales bacterium]